VQVKGHGSAKAHGSNKKAAEREAAALLLAKLPL
jgi:dsRNA-specific ribonuclease